MKMRGLLAELKAWRETVAGREGVELYRVMPNAVLEEIARTLPKTREELMSIKGIKEAKCRKYGADILKLVVSYQASGDMASSDIFVGESRITNHQSQKEKGKRFVVAISPSRDATAAIQKENKLNRHASQGETCDDNKGISDEVSALAITEEAQVLTVSQFLDGVNLELSGMAARVRGEVTSFDERERVVYFSIKDMKDGSTLSCLIFRSVYLMSGVRMVIGDEVIVEGAPEVWKPMGKLSFKCGFIEYAGEGALKKAYDALLAKLMAEGLLAPERKREISAFPTRIALLTSRDGAAIGDFMMNVGRHGYKIDLYASSVEGARAVSELLAGVRYFARHANRYDVLVVIRGGGSLESLQAFNNEMLVREIAMMPIPVIAGIGHEKDITLATLVADAGVSTPTAASRLVRQSWEEGAERVGDFSYRLSAGMSSAVALKKDRIGDLDSVLSGYFLVMKERIRTIIERFLAKRETILYAIRGASEAIVSLGDGMVKGKDAAVAIYGDWLSQFEKTLKQYDPTRALALGYSLVRLGSGKILRASTDATVGDRLEIRLSKGSIGAEVKEII